MNSHPKHQVQVTMRTAIRQTARAAIRTRPNGSPLDESVLNEFATALFQEYPTVDQTPYSDALVQELTDKLVHNYQTFVAKLEALPPCHQNSQRPRSVSRKQSPQASPVKVAAK